MRTATAWRMGLIGFAFALTLLVGIGWITFGRLADLRQRPVWCSTLYSCKPRRSASPRCARMPRPVSGTLSLLFAVQEGRDEVSKADQAVGEFGVRAALRATRSSALARYATAVGVALLAILFRLALDPVWGTRLPYITLFPAIMLSAWLGGFWPGIVTTLLCATAAEYFWIEPIRSWGVTDKSELLGLLVFVAVAGTISALNEAWRRGAVALAESEERLSVTLTSIGDGVVATDDHGCVIQLNAVAESLTGWTMAEATGRPLEEVFVIVNEHTRQPVENPALRAMRDGGVVGLANHTVLIAKDGTEIPIDDSGSPIRTEGKTVGAVLIFRDVSERRRIDKDRDVLAEQGRMLNAGFDAIVVRDGHDRVISWNRVAEELYGWTRDEAMGQVTHELFQTRFPKPLEEITRELQRENRWEGELTHTRRDGSVVTVLSHWVLDRDAHGQPRSVLEINIDISGRKRAEERFRLAVEAAPAAMIMVDQRGTIVLINALTERLLGYARDEMVGQPIDRLVPPRFREQHPEFRRMFHAAPVQRLMGAGRELYALRKDGSEVPVEIGLSPIETHEGVFVLAAVTDITARKEIDEQRALLLAREQAARSEVERASRLKDEFLAVLSHELRTPLNAVLGYSQLLTSGALPPERAARALESIQRNAQAQARLVESLLDLSRIMAGKLELDLQNVDVSKIVDAAIDVVRPHAAANSISLDVIAPRSPVSVIADGGRLQQVLWNLLSNAIKFTPREGRVAIRWTEDGTQVRIEVSDNGQGINAAFLPHVFDRFSQADEEKRRSRAGLGLGLALVREMVQAHGGTVAAESPGDGRGSTFTVSLPMSSAASAAVPRTSDAAADDRVESLSPLAILIVDDDRDGRDLLALMLESRGAVTRAVSSAADALEAIRQGRPDVLLADLRMPDEDGYSLIRKIRGVERNRQDRRLPAIAVTAFASPSDREQAIAAGYDAHVAKPVDPGELTRAIVRVAKADSI